MPLSQPTPHSLGEISKERRSFGDIGRNGAIQAPNIVWVSNTLTDWAFLKTMLPPRTGMHCLQIKDTLLRNTTLVAPTRWAMAFREMMARRPAGFAMPLNKDMPQLNIAWEPGMRAVVGCRRTWSRRRAGIAKAQIKGTRMRNFH